MSHLALPAAEVEYAGSKPVPKVIGADFELGNLILGVDDDGKGTCHEASRAVLAEIHGVPNRRAPERAGSTTGVEADGYDLQDWGRKFLPTNGGCAYVDLDHTEMNTPEVLSAHDHVASVHAMLRIARDAMTEANRRLPPGRRIVLLANNSDGKGHSYGSHLSVLIGREAWDELFDRRMYPAIFELMAIQASSIVLTGQGKVGAENGHEWVPYQLSQRADFFETLVGPQTTFRRPLVNSRDESHCGSPYPGSADDAGRRLARLHCIFFDQALCHGTLFLRAGIMQLTLAMLEAGRIDAGLLLDDPLAAVWAWSRDPGLRTRARLHSGARVTAVELQLLFLEQVVAFVDGGGASGCVPGARRIVDYWARTLEELERRDFDALARKLDWVRKKTLLERAMADASGLDWASPEIAYLDQIYASLDETEGLYWACERDGAVDRLASPAEIERLVHHPPPDTRARTRAALLRAIPHDQVIEMDWSYIRIRRPRGRATGAASVRLLLPDPARAPHGILPTGEHAPWNASTSG